MGVFYGFDLWFDYDVDLGNGLVGIVDDVMYVGIDIVGVVDVEMNLVDVDI